MTNFYTSENKIKSLGGNNPYLLVPIITGVIVSLLILLSIELPLALNIIKNRKEISESLFKQTQIPLMKKSLITRNIELNKYKSQQNRILEIIAGSRELSTYLSRINLLSKSNQVEILEIKPLSVETYQDPSLQAIGEDIAKDNLLIKGLEKRSVEIKVKGTFTNILSFLRKIERLQMIVIPTDLKISKEDFKTNKLQNKLQTIFELKLSIYGRQ